MTLRSIGKKYNGTSPGNISITYFYPEEHRDKHYESYDARSILKFLEYIENDGWRVIEFSIDPEPIPEDCCYTGWGFFYTTCKSSIWKTLHWQQVCFIC